MNSEKMRQTLLEETVAEEIPESSIDLWTGIEKKMIERSVREEKSKLRSGGLKLVYQISFLILSGLAVLMLTDQGRSLAQEIMHFFTRAETDRLPLVEQGIDTESNKEAQVSDDGQSAPISEESSQDPASILFANEEVVEVENELGFDIFEPTWLPEVLSFSGASFDPEHGIAYQFFSYSSELDPDGTLASNGLRIHQEPIDLTENCDLCGVVGASAYVVTVYIGDTQGEYVEGVWKNTNSGAVWDPDPYLKTMRWQKEGMAFEMLYMGPPEDVTMKDMIAIAESLQ